MATCSGYFFDELVLQILLLLPLKSQGRFRSVSKHWRSLISNDPRPVRGLLIESRDSIHLLPLDSNSGTLCNLQYSSLPFDRPRQPRFELLESCNGLLLFGRRGRFQGVIYNPLTRQHATLPLCTCCLHSHHDHVTASLVYDPSKSPHYKLLCLCRYCFMIYSSKTSSWTCWANSSFERRLRAIVNSYDSTPEARSVHWNGSIYYVCDGRKDLYKLYRFDTDHEVMLRTELPYDGFETCCVKRLVESWGRLYMLASLGDQQLEVYEMESHRSGWRLKYRLDNFGRDLKLCFYSYGNGFKIRLGGRKIFDVPSDNWEVFFPAPESGGEDELWLVVAGGLLVYRYGLGSKSVAVVKDRHHGDSRGPNPYRGIKAHTFAESILYLPRPLQ